MHCRRQRESVGSNQSRLAERGQRMVKLDDVADALKETNNTDTLIRLVVSVALIGANSASSSGATGERAKALWGDLVSKGATSRQMMHLARSPGAVLETMAAWRGTDVRKQTKSVLSAMFWPAEHLLLASTVGPAKHALVGGPEGTAIWTRRSATFMVGFHAISLLENAVAADVVATSTSLCELLIALTRSTLWVALDGYKTGLAGAYVCVVYLIKACLAAAKRRQTAAANKPQTKQP